ncbi:DUF6477 family protein [Pseudogemmobacter sonorensis]|uniref:DUF6477 family protein n=1 Tax=Pseudogemmobacter sonorensis TaxID=2989681 RepID=UPI0036A7D10D
MSDFPIPDLAAPDLRRAVSELRRPGILMRATRFGLAEYQRGRLLKRLTPGETRPERTVPRLYALEAAMEARRRQGDSIYSVSDHIEVLVALVAEASLLRPNVEPSPRPSVDTPRIYLVTGGAAPGAIAGERPNATVPRPAAAGRGRGPGPGVTLCALPASWA